MIVKTIEKSSGVDIDTMNQAIMRMIGLNVTNIDPMQIRLSLNYLDKERSDAVKTMNRIKKDQSLSLDERERRLKSYYSKLEFFRLKKAVLLNAGVQTTNIMERLKREDKK